MNRFLEDEQLVPLAKLFLALAEEDPPATARAFSDCGVVIENAAELFVCHAAHLIFDTRMDMEEATMAPWDEDAVEFRSASLSRIPEDLFLVARVVAVMRGLLAAVGADVHAAKIWAPHAREFLRRKGRLEEPTEQDKAGKHSSGGTGLPSDLYERMKRLGEWMRDNGMPHSRRALAPLAMNGITTVEDILRADDRSFDRAFRHFADDEKSAVKALARSEVSRMKGGEDERDDSAYNLNSDADDLGLPVAADGESNAPRGLCYCLVPGCVRRCASLLLSPWEKEKNSKVLICMYVSLRMSRVSSQKQQVNGREHRQQS